jgi:hypothetical protein
MVFWHKIGVNRRNRPHLEIRPGCFAPLAGVCLLLAAERNAWAQEALRMSMTGDLAAESQRRQSSALGYYNLLLGPTAWRFGSSLSLEYDDNVGLAQTGSESDLIIRPGLNAQMHWPFSLQNSLDFSLGAGYSEYLSHSDLNQFYLTPGSGFSFDIYAGAFKINLHDRISITENAYESAGVSGNNQNLERLQNSAGTTVFWDMGKATASLGYDHGNYAALSQSQGTPDANSDNFYANTGFQIQPELMVGLEAGDSLINYSQTAAAEEYAGMNQWSLGVFGSSQISDHLSVRLDAGYTGNATDGGGATLAPSDSSGFYFSSSLSHQVNARLNYTLAVGRSTDLAAYGELQTYYFVRLNPNFNIFEKCTISTPVWWQSGTEGAASATQIPWPVRGFPPVVRSAQPNGDYVQYGLGLTISRPLTQHLSGNLSDQYVHESANQGGVAYAVNIISLSFSYQF